MHSTLDEAVSRAVLLARVTERALHNPRNWKFLLGEVETPAKVTRTNDGITFTGELVALEVGDQCLELRHRNQVQLATPLSVTKPSLYRIRWVLRPEEDRAEVH